MPNAEASEDILETELIRSPEWMRSAGCAAGAVIQLDLPEMALQGAAQVVSIEPCPPLEVGSGRIVLSTVSHLNTQLVQVRFTGSEETIEPTDRHRLYSVTRGDWVAAGTLTAGEILKTRTGQATISSVTPKPGVYQVYNLEVETQHSYYVGALEILSHNVNPCANPNKAPVSPGQTGAYGDLKTQKKAFGETEPMDMDHQPSFAAQVKAREAALGRPLKKAELAEVKASTPAVASPRGVHQQTSPTYGGRNTSAQIAEDAADLNAAASRDRAIFEEAMRNR